MAEFPHVPFGEFARPVARPVKVQPGVLYRTLGVKWWGEGAYERATMDGSTIRTETLSIVKTGDLIFNKIWVRHGSSGVIPPEMDGCVASGEFPTFELDNGRIDHRWLLYLFKTAWFWEQCNLRSQGTSGKNRIKPGEYLQIAIPLPPLAEQQRIVARIEALARRVEEARGLRREAVEVAEALERSLLDGCYRELSTEWGITPLGSACQTITDGDHITPKFSESGTKFIFVGNVSSGFLHFRNCKYVTAEYYASVRPQRKPKIGDILYSAVGATLGVPAIVDKSDDFCFQRHVAIIKPDRNKLDSKFLWHILRTAIIYTWAWSKTTGSAQPTVPLNAIREFPVVVPPLAKQRNTVAYLDGLQAKVDDLRRLQAESQAELDALMPSVLAQAFAGEL
jgi:type I restriction enzyme S subunit